jgi:hypothetical protein
MRTEGGHYGLAGIVAFAPVAAVGFLSFAAAGSAAELHDGMDKMNGTVTHHLGFLLLL